MEWKPRRKWIGAIDPGREIDDDLKGWLIVNSTENPNSLEWLTSQLKSNGNQQNKEKFERDQEKYRRREERIEENDAKFKYTNDCREEGGTLSVVLQECGNPEECKIVIAN
ncbi:hypothetical protein WR25_06491 [Diploscapter pachys]|uniref:Uncharacterized protein n=1 Tax=Diploscapter pachys TaxID=2018661 RepID=A0A2A2J331_9BILA|nr:hypothetical protein WR25_06491 [Diploscapter pachys]